MMYSRIIHIDLSPQLMRLLFHQLPRNDIVRRLENFEQVHHSLLGRQVSVLFQLFPECFKSLVYSRFTVKSDRNHAAHETLEIHPVGAELENADHLRLGMLGTLAISLLLHRFGMMKNFLQISKNFSEGRRWILLCSFMSRLAKSEKIWG